MGLRHRRYLSLAVTTTPGNRAYHLAGQMRVVCPWFTPHSKLWDQASRSRGVGRLSITEEAPGSDLGSGTDCRDWDFFMIFLSPSKQIPGEHLKLCQDRFLTIPFQLIIHYLCSFLMQHHLSNHK
jgi:hypothetical protein